MSRPARVLRVRWKLQANARHGSGVNSESTFHYALVCDAVHCLFHAYANKTTVGDVKTMLLFDRCQCDKPGRDRDGALIRDHLPLWATHPSPLIICLFDSTIIACASGNNLELGLLKSTESDPCVADCAACLVVAPLGSGEIVVARHSKLDGCDSASFPVPRANCREERELLRNI